MSFSRVCARGEARAGHGAHTDSVLYSAGFRRDHELSSSGESRMKGGKKEEQEQLWETRSPPPDAAHSPRRVRSGLSPRSILEYLY